MITEHKCEKISQYNEKHNDSHPIRVYYDDKYCNEWVAADDGFRSSLSDIKHCPWCGQKLKRWEKEEYMRVVKLINERVKKEDGNT